MGEVLKIDHRGKHRYRNFIETGYGVDLELIDVDLINYDLRGVVLRNAIIENVDFSGANLMYSDFRGAVFSNVNFDRAKLDFSNFEDCEFHMTASDLLDRGSFWGSNFRRVRYRDTRNRWSWASRDFGIRQTDGNCPKLLQRIDEDAKAFFKMEKNRVHDQEQAVFEAARRLEGNYREPPRKFLKSTQWPHMDRLAVWWTSRGLVPPWSIMRN